MFDNGGMNRLLRGSRGDPVLDIQVRLSALGYPIDPKEHGQFGPSTEASVRDFQQRRHLLVDGEVGVDTWQQLVEAGYRLGDRVLYLRYPYFRGDDVRELQAALNLLGFDAGREDGILGERTDDAIHDFQRNAGLPADGIVGVTTIEALRHLRGVGIGPGRAAVREAEALRRLDATLSGARIAIDPGHGPGDTGVVGPEGAIEADLTQALAIAVLGALETRGAFPFLLRRPDTNPAVSERAAGANDAGAEVCISLHLAAHDAGRPAGAVAYYYGRADWASQAGRRLADAILGALEDLVELGPTGAEPKQIAVLRETRMPAVHLEPLDLNRPGDEARLKDPAFLQTLAGAIAAGVEAFFGSSKISPAPEDTDRLPLAPGGPSG